MTPKELDDAAQSFYQAILDGPRGQGFARAIVLREDETLTGPFDAWLRTPFLGGHLERAGMAFRTDTVLSAAAREVAVLVVANAWQVEFEWHVHYMLAKQCGLSDDVLAAIQQRETPSFDADDCLAAYNIAVALVYERKLPNQVFESGKAVLGERALVEVVTLVGFYQLVSGMLESFRPPEASVDISAPPPQSAVQSSNGG